MSLSDIRMPNTDGIAFQIVAQSNLGFAGFYKRSDGRFEVRVYPTKPEFSSRMIGVLPSANRWTQPSEMPLGGSPYGYFWRAVDGDQLPGLKEAMTEALHGIIAGGHVPVTNDDAPSWLRNILSRAELLRVVTARRVRGYNLAHGWSYDTLCAKVSPSTVVPAR